MLSSKKNEVPQRNSNSGSQPNLLLEDTFSAKGISKNNEEINFPQTFSKKGNSFQKEITSPEHSTDSSFVNSSLIEFCPLLPHGIDKYCIIMDYDF